MSRPVAWIACAGILAACSPTARIASSANDIRAEATLLVEHGTTTGDTVTVSHAKKIDELAARIHEDLPGAQDRTPAWVSMLIWVAGAVCAVCVVVVLWQTGLGAGIRAALGWIPRKTQSRADLALSMLDPSRPEGDREFIAALRQDPEFDAAFRRAKARKETQT